MSYVLSLYNCWPLYTCTQLKREIELAAEESKRLMGVQKGLKRGMHMYRAPHCFLVMVVRRDMFNDMY